MLRTQVSPRRERGVDPLDEIELAPAQTTLATSELECTDNALIELWLHGRSLHTVRAYRSDVARFRAFVAKPIVVVTLGELQAFADSLTGCEASRARTLGAVRSLLRFAHTTGAAPFNVGAALRIPKGRDGLADRILTERQVKRLRKAPASPRDVALIHLLYEGAFRRGEICGLRWSDAAAADDEGAFLTVLGKRKKTRTVRISKETWAMVAALRGDAPSNAPVFAGRAGALDPATVWRIVRSAARRAGIEAPVSPHFLRHSHATHALERGAPMGLVRDTLGHDSLATTSRYVHARPKESSGKYLR